MIVLRALDALKARDLSFRAFGLLAFLCGEADFRTGKVTMSLRAMSDTVAWDGTTDWLRKNLRLLRDGGWLDYESRPGQQKPYVITLTGARPRGPASAPTADEEAVLPAEATSDESSELRPPKRSPHAVRGARQPQTPAGLQERQRDDGGGVEDEGFVDVISPLGRLTRRQRAEAHEAWKQNPSAVRQCVKEAMRGRTPPALFVSLLKDVDLTITDSAPDWFVQTYERHPSDPSEDRVSLLGPMTHDEARAVAAADPDATVIRGRGSA